MKKILILLFLALLMCSNGKSQNCEFDVTTYEIISARTDANIQLIPKNMKPESPGSAWRFIGFVVFEDPNPEMGWDWVEPDVFEYQDDPRFHASTSAYAYEIRIMDSGCYGFRLYSLHSIQHMVEVSGNEIIHTDFLLTPFRNLAIEASN